MVFNTKQLSDKLEEITQAELDCYQHQGNAEEQVGAVLELISKLRDYEKLVEKERSIARRLLDSFQAEKEEINSTISQLSGQTNVLLTTNHETPMEILKKSDVISSAVKRLRQTQETVEGYTQQLIKLEKQ